MPPCFLCCKRFEKAAGLFAHFSLCHPRHDFQFYTCIEDGCNRNFHLKNTFQRHIREHERVNVTSESFNHTPTISESNIEVAPSSIPVLPLNVLHPLPSHELEEGTSFLPHFLASLYADPIIPRKNVQYVVDSISKIIKIDVLSSVRKVLQQSSDECIPSTALQTIEDKIVSAIQKPLDPLQTEHRRMKYFEETGSYIAPKEVVIGQKLLSSGAKKSLLSTTCTEQFVPLRLVLKKFLSLENILLETITYMENLYRRNYLIENFIQGEFWKQRKKNHGGRLVFPLFIFFDDYETGNAIGSHSGYHKLGAIYTMIACLPPQYSSALQTIFLTLLFHSSDRSRFGNGIILSPLIEELNYLQEEGIEFDVPGFKGIIYFELGLILGDNLGLHAVTGFVESFSANFPCRICNIEKSQLATQTYFTDEHLLRNKEQYEQVIKQSRGISETGVKEKCAWLEVQNFSLFDQVGVDFMHDMLEGVAKYVMCFLLTYYIKKLRLFTIDILNQRILSFDYGLDQGSKPCALKYENLKNNKLRLTASEVLTLVRYFGLLVGDLIPINEPIWEMYIILRRVLDVLLSKTTDIDTADSLGFLISELNDLYLLHTKDTLKPKFHFLLHYPLMMRKFGPVTNLWSMRFEAKHRPSKMAAKSSCNRRNICKTLAIKHQLQLNRLFLAGKLKPLLKLGKKKTVTRILRQKLNRVLFLNASKPLVKVAWVKYKHTKYKKNLVLITDVAEDGIIFSLIKQIFVYNHSEIIFQCSRIRNLGFEEHLFAYEVEHPVQNQLFYIFHHDVVNPIPNNINIVPSGQKFVSVRSP